MLASAAVAALLACVQEGQVITGSDRASALRIQLSGGLDLHYSWRDGTANEAGAVLNGAAPGDMDSTRAWGGRVTLRADVFLKSDVTGVIELENRDFDEGLNAPFGADPEEDAVNLKQAYIDLAEFLVGGLDLRIGVQEVAWRTRAQDEPFFLHLGESEGFFEGFSATGHVRNSVDRDVREAAGVRAIWQVVPIASAQLIAMTADESIYALVANARPADTLSVWFLAAVVSGGPPGVEQVWTFGGGADWFFGEAKPLELFAEGYLQRGRLTRDVDKRAFAGNAGARVFIEGFWIEAAVSHRSGNGSVTDGEDEAFQSYEDENRFLVLQSAEFGLDVDTNVRVVRAAAGYGPIDLGGRPLRVQVDVGRFAADEVLRDVAGAAGRERDWGIETDVSLTWSYTESVSIWLKGAWLASSELLEDLTLDRRDEARIFVTGASLKF